MKRRILPLTVVCTVLVVFSGCQASRDEPAQETAAATPATIPAAAEQSGDTTTQRGMLDPNGATREELLALPGMDAAAVDALIAGRTYTGMVAVDRILAKHLTEPEREVVYARLWKPLDLNTASGEEILLIPGLGERMKHEFEEYRPYRSMEQFRREIGKYVDKTEVARLERYVMIR